MSDVLQLVVVMLRRLLWKSATS